MGSKARYLTYALGGVGLTAVVASIAIAADPGFPENISGGWHQGRDHGHGHGHGHDHDHHRGHGLRFLTQMDADGDGAVTRSEIEAFQAARAVTIDSNGDGEVTVEELEAYREAQRRERMAARLAAMDSDGDGKVSVAELQAAATWRLARLDRDGDGVIELRGAGRGGPGMHGDPDAGPADGDAQAQ